MTTNDNTKESKEILLPRTIQITNKGDSMKKQKRNLLEVMDGALGYMSGKYTPTPISEKYHDEIGNIVFDTCYTSDTGCYETGIIDPRYYDSWIIVEEYSSKSQSKTGHAKWIKKLTTGKPPKYLPSVQVDNYPLKETL